jgi:hypothetical protein
VVTIMEMVSSAPTITTKPWAAPWWASESGTHHTHRWPAPKAGRRRPSGAKHGMATHHVRWRGPESWSASHHCWMERHHSSHMWHKPAPHHKSSSPASKITIAATAHLILFCLTFNNNCRRSVTIIRTSCLNCIRLRRRCLHSFWFRSALSCDWLSGCWSRRRGSRCIVTSGRCIIASTSSCCLSGTWRRHLLNSS